MRALSISFGSHCGAGFKQSAPTVTGRDGAPVYGVGLRCFVAPGSLALKHVIGLKAVESPPLKFVRPRQSLIASMVFGVVFGGR